VTVRQRKRGEEKKERKELQTLFTFFLLFLHAGKILIFIKNNMENIKYILTVKFNSV